MSSNNYSHLDVREFDGLRSCLGCGETRFHAPSLSTDAADQGREYLYTDLRCLKQGRTIRLLVLEPGDYDDPIHCSLVLSELQHAQYDAVSYTWATEDGDDHKSQPLKIDNSVFYVTKNCDAALRCLRRRESRKLWIDALCVNQANINERNHQVGMMDQIYRDAIRVHICIQDPLHDHSLCMRWLNMKEGYPVLQEHVKDQFRDLFALRYFSRVWVIQEVVLAKSVIFHVNNDIVEWSKNIFAELHVITPPLVDAFLSKEVFQNVAGVLEISQSSSCSDPRDRVYGVISLLPPHLRTLIPVDYSLLTEETFANAVFACIQSTGSLAILHFAHLDDEEPNLTLARSFTVEHLRLYTRWATGLPSTRHSIPFDDANQRLNSLYFDHNGSLTHNQGSDKVVLSKDQAQVQVIAGHILPCLRVRALLIDISTSSGFRYKAERIVNLSFEATLRFYCEFVEKCEWTNDHGCESLVMFYTRYGTGLSAVKSMPGDQLFHIEGARPLFLLRNLAPGRFRIVGACYWQQTSSPNKSTWLDIEADAVQNAAVRVHDMIEIY